MFIRKIAAAVAVTVIASMALATNGLFSHGNGIKGKGMGGTGVALTHDAFGAANNPATIMNVGNRADLGLDIFMPKRSASRTGGAMLNHEVDSDKNTFFVPEFGYSRGLNEKMAWGLAIYGNGGTNVEYPGLGVDCSHPSIGGSANSNILCGSTELKANLEQLILAPTFAYKVHDNHTLGIALLYGYQRIEVNGLQAFMGASSDSTKVSDNGVSTASGIGFRVGWHGAPTDTISVGLAYSTKVNMSKFDEYSGLFAEQGKLDIPAIGVFGIAYRATESVLIAFDITNTRYSEVAALNNKPDPYHPLAAPTNPKLGEDDGPGFGWEDQTFYKLGLEYKQNETWTYRAGINYGKSPISEENSGITFSMLAPATTELHVTLGATWMLNESGELNFHFMYSPENSLSSNTGQFASAAGGTEEVSMNQMALGIGYSWLL